MPGCRCLNKNAHPEPTKGCSEGCMMCCGYTTPGAIGFLIAGLVITSDVYSIILIARNPHSAWRIIVCLIVFILTTALGVVVSWAYYEVIFTSPGYVPREVWQYPPTPDAPPPPQPQSSQQPSQRSCPAGGDGTSAGTSAQPTQQQPPPLQQQHLGPSMARRSPNNGGSLTQPPSYPTPPPPLHAEEAVTVNPLLDGTDADPRKPVGGICAKAPVNAVMYSDSAESGNGQPPPPPHDHHGSGHVNANNDGDAVTPPVVAQEMTKDGGSGGGSGSPVGVLTGSHSPYATPPLQANRIPMATATATAPSRNPYRVRETGPNGALRFCYTCKIYKPDGAHHCRVCGRCVFNFDHHCPFVNNCIGRNNYKLFVIFLLYSAVGCLLAGGLMAVTLFAVDRDEIMTKIGWVAVPAVDVVLGLSLFLFYIQHRVLLCNGETTLDSIARGDDTFQGWRESLSRPRLTAAEKAERKRQKQVKVERHYRTVMGNESPWWRRYLPVPVRTDDTADDTVPGNV